MRVERCFGFVDLCGFTTFNERFGDERTVLVLAELRATLREIAARRGVRVVKWLGDGAMLSPTMPDAVARLVLEARQRLARATTVMQLRVGLDLGPVIMFEGDDYIGRAVNCASRLCDAAAPDQILAARSVAGRLPHWIVGRPVDPAPLAGFSAPVEIVELALVASVDDGDTVVDPVCGLPVPASVAVESQFCSIACAGVEAA